MNNELQKKLVATHDRVDPSMVTAEDLVRAIIENSHMELALKLGYVRQYDINATRSANLAYNHFAAVRFIASRIYPYAPEDKPTTVKLTTGATVSYEQYKIVADYQDEVLPFSEPINGVEQ